MNKKWNLFIILLFTTSISFSQTITGTVFDSSSQEPLAFANLGILGKPIGAVTNSDGKFFLSIAGLSTTDTLVCSFVGYESQRIAVNKLDSVTNFKMFKSSTALSAITVFANPIPPQEIIAKMIANRGANYTLPAYEARIFRREQGIFIKDHFNIACDQSTLPVFKDNFVEQFNNMPPKMLYYVDKLFDVYYNGNAYKIHDLKRVEQVDGKMDELKALSGKMEKAMDATSSNDVYWKVKTGPFISLRLDKDPIRIPNDSASLKDSTINVTMQSLADKIWNQDFITKMRKYDYELEGGTDISGEPVYIVHFTPSGGRFEGRMYISQSTFALLRLDYQVAENQRNKGISILGVTFKNTTAKGTVIYQHYKDHYCMKYFLDESSDYVKVKRPMTLVAKKKRFFFDKTVQEVDFKLDFSFNQTVSTEYLVTRIAGISNADFNKQPKIIRIVTQGVKQYNDPTIWKGYSIIEPTEEMKQYKSESSQ